MVEAAIFYYGLFSYSMMDLLSDSKDSKFLRWFLMRVLLSQNWECEAIILQSYISYFISTHIALHTQYKQKSMNSSKEADYNEKLTIIQNKFQLVCKKYQQLADNLKSKEQTIAKMASQISQLTGKLETANQTIAQLQKQISKSQLLQKTYYLRHRANLQSNQLIESEFASSPNLQEKLKSPKIEVYYEMPNQKSSQQSISGQGSIVKYKHIRLGSNQETTRRVKTNLHKAVPSILKVKTNQTQAEDNSLNRVKSVEFMKIEDDGEEPKMKTLQKIWLERDHEICKMDELFESLTTKLKEYQ